MTKFSRLPDHARVNLRLLPTLGLAFFLLFAQQGAALHAVSHLAEGAPAQSKQEKHLPHSPACDKCVAYAGIGSAASSSPLPPLPVMVAGFLAEAFSPTFSSPSLAAYSARAPPSLI